MFIKIKSSIVNAVNFIKCICDFSKLYAQKAVDIWLNACDFKSRIKQHNNFYIYTYIIYSIYNIQVFSEIIVN